MSDSDLTIRISETLPPPPPPIEFWKPSQFIGYQPPKDLVLVGDNHLVRGATCVIGGSPGVGKSRMIPPLAVAGATGKGEWMGLPVHCQFRTLVVQAENGAARMKSELSSLNVPGDLDLDDWLRITPPPLFGLDFASDEFCEFVRDYVCVFEPGLLVVDPWNAVVRKDDIQAFRDALERLHSVLPAEPERRPALAIIHHLRKRKGDPKRGRELLEELSGSYSIGAAARSAFILQAATADQEDDRVVLTCAKNNDGEPGPSTAWHREGDGFSPCEDFDFDVFFEGSAESRRSISADVMRRALGEGGIRKGEFVSRMKQEGFERSASYGALNRFEQVEEDSKGRVYWKEPSA